MAAAGEMMRVGRVRPLATAGDRRIPALGEVPLLKELGFSPRFSLSGFSGLLAPARTPQPVLDRLAEVFRIAAAKPETHRRLLAVDTVPSYQDPATFKAQIARNLPRMDRDNGEAEPDDRELIRRQMACAIRVPAGG